MSVEPALERSVVVRAMAGVRDRLATLLAPVADRLRPAERAVTRVVRGSWCYRWLTADPDRDPVVVDLRETYTVGPVLAVLDRLAGALGGSATGGCLMALRDRLHAAPARAVGLACCLAFGASLLGAVLAGALTLPGYLFHAAGLLVGLAGVRDHRDWDRLRESRFWGTVVAVLAPQPADGERDGR